MDWLHLNAECKCCCHEHTFPGCPARIWAGCRSGLYAGEKEQDPWAYLAWWESKHGKQE